MNARAMAIVAVAAFTVASPGLALDQGIKRVAGTVKVPAGVKLRKNLQFNSFTPRLAAAAVPVADRLPFKCLQDWDSWWRKPRVLVWYAGASAVQTQKLRVYWSLEGCCSHTVAAPTSNYMLYPNEGFLVYDGVPPNLNMPPEGQSLLNCTAYGWIEK